MKVKKESAHRLEVYPVDESTSGKGIAPTFLSWFSAENYDSKDFAGSFSYFRTAIDKSLGYRVEFLSCSIQGYHNSSPGNVTLHPEVQQYPKKESSTQRLKKVFITLLAMTSKPLESTSEDTISSIHLEKPLDNTGHLVHDDSNSPTYERKKESSSEFDDIEEHPRYSLTREPTNPIEKENVITRTLSVVRTKDSGRDPGPPPDGGFHAWLQAILAHAVIFNTWGFVNSFGMFQDYYTETLKRSPSDISWVGSVQIFLLFGIGTFSGRATDAGFFKAVWSLGAVTIMFAVFMTSLCKTYLQLFLAQGLCLGIGSGLIFCPTVALVSTYFSSRRSIAIAISACGSATGGIIFPIIVQQLLPRIGYPWTMRVLGLVTVITLAPGFIFFRTRIPPRRSGPFFEWPAFKEPSYSLYAIGMFLNFWALYIGFFYINSFGRNAIGLSQSEGLTILMIMNALGTVGRMIPSFLADYFIGPMNALIPFTFASSIVLFAWSGVKSSPTLYAFSALYGFFGAGMQALFPAVATSLSTDMKKTGVRFGMILSIVSVASLTGPPIAGALIEKGNGSYLYMQLFAGLSMLLGTGVLILARFALTGPKLKAKV
ncbi:hypothetical protein LOZ23_001992 [Ophidiomyces ophidiicola]|nr:hypothetical protein LOZ23_001992 [Ophidiomyces ophidiicola]KAI2177996.1 hypothetical protein LOZ24_002281 [Ophidiomyces ophidiicola]KAI2196428.1 hypothetical protein LOZ20_003048 [Ophidiomyces ophidiicola]KAI2371121.1 hypothetical protein LOY93_002145 [Ophidiomyces ophidiicola]